MSDNTKIWPDDFSEDELIDSMAHDLMAAVNEGGRSWSDDEFLESEAEYLIGGVPLDESHVDKIIERAKDRYSPSQ